MQVKVATDSSAASGVIRRKGLGKLRHLETIFLWVQDVAASNKIEYAKEAGSSNRADICTKHTPRELIERHCKYMRCGFPVGKAKQVAIADEVTLQHWSREDRESQHLRRPHRGGPDLKDAVWRRTEDLYSGKTMLFEGRRELQERNHNEIYFKSPANTKIVYCFIPREHVAKMSSTTSSSSSSTPTSTPSSS